MCSFYITKNILVQFGASHWGLFDEYYVSSGRTMCRQKLLLVCERNLPRCGETYIGSMGITESLRLRVDFSIAVKCPICSNIYSSQHLFHQSVFSAEEVQYPATVPHREHAGNTKSAKNQKYLRKIMLRAGDIDKKIYALNLAKSAVSSSIEEVLSHAAKRTAS